jgi:hypothetical protein
MRSLCFTPFLCKPILGQDKYFYISTERNLQFRLVVILLHIAIFLWLYLTLEQNVISFAGSKEITKENSFSRCTKFTKNQRLSLNFGNSSLRSSDSPKFLTLVPRFSLRKFHEAGRNRDRSLSFNTNPFKPLFFSSLPSLFFH